MKKNLIFVIYLILTISIFSQNDAFNNIHSQPEVAEIERYGDIPVNKSTGIPNINIPLYNLKSDGITIPFSLNYYAAGIKVNQEATWVGLGWDLRGATNVITRNVNGLNDANNNGYFSSSNRMMDVYDNHFLSGFIGIANNNIATVASGVEFDRNDIWVDGVRQTNLDEISRKIRDRSFDWEPDLFTFNFLGYSGSFVFDQNRTIHLINNKDKLIFRKLPGYETGWIVKAPDGIKMKFIDKVIHRTAPPFNVSRVDWFLSEIEALNGEKISFSYSPTAGLVTSKNIIESFRTSTLGGSPPYNSTPFFHYYGPMYLDRIDTNNGYIIFDKSNRDDFGYGDIGKKLDRMKIYTNDNTLIKEVEFNTDYFISPIGGDSNSYIKLSSASPSTIDKQLKRLKLDGISQIINGEVKSHNFVYNSTPLPRKSSYSTDFWGYYNGRPNTSFISDYRGSVRNIYYLNGVTLDSHDSFIDHIDINRFGRNSANKKSESSTTKANVLNKIIFPTKGSTTFEYDLNDYSNTEAEHIENETFVIFQNFNGPNVDDIPSETFVVNQNMLKYSKAKITINAFINSSSFNFYDYISVKIDDTVIHRYFLNEYGSFFHVDIIEDLGILPGQNVTLEIHKQNGFIGLIHASIKYYHFEFPLKSNGGGLRIKNIIKDDNNGNIDTISYDYSLNSNTSGILKVPNRFYNDMCYNYFTPMPQTVDTEHKYIYTKFYGQSSNALSYNQSNYIGYSKVTERNSTNGFSEYYYYNKENFSYFSFIDRPISLPTVKQDFDGNIKTEKYYSFTNKLVKKIDYKYTIKNRNIIKAFNRGYRLKATSTPGETTYLYPYSSFLHYYPIISKSEHLIEKKIQTFNTDVQNAIIQTDNYFYDNDAHSQLTKTETTTSIGDLLTKNIFYPQDKIQINNLTQGASIAIDSLVAQHRITIPIQVETKKNGVLTSKTRNNFKDFGLNTQGSGNIVMPNTTQTSKVNNPLEDRIIYHQYNSSGNPIEISKADGTHICYIWGYNKTQPIAKIENINYSAIPQTELNALLNFNYTTGSETLLLTKLASLRNHASMSNTMITTMTYKPLIGLSTITDPKGDKQTYHYDNFNRLQFVKDKFNNIVNENAYHYRD